MNPLRLLAIVLIVAGIIALLYGGFTYTRETHDASIGPLELSIKDEKTIPIPAWVGIGAILAGGGLLFVRRGG